MISIDVKNIGYNISKLNKTIEEYESTYLNLFNTTNSIQTLWTGVVAENYFEEINHDKLETQKLIEKIKNRQELYKYIYDSYKELGNKINCNLNAKDEIITKINNCINTSKEILKIYESIDITKNYKEKEKIQKHQETTKKILKRYKTIKENVQMIYSNIEEIEKKINKELENYK